jgi:hypothetical protein
MITQSDLQGMAARDNPVDLEVAKRAIADLTGTPAPRGAINAFLVRRKDERGDLVGTIALYSFLAMLIALLLGGSEFARWGLTLRVPALDIQALVALLSPIIAHTVKSTVEGAKP